MLSGSLECTDSYESCMFCHGIGLFVGPVKSSALKITGDTMYRDSLKRAFCRMIVPRLVTYSYGTLTGYPVILQPMCRQLSRIQFSQKIEARLKSVDKVPDGYELIYRAPMTSYVKLAHVTSSVSVLLLGVVGVYKYITNATFNVPLKFEGNEFNQLGDIQLDNDLTFLVSMFIMFNVGICAVTLRYPVRIYCHEEASSYICVLNRFLPLSTKNITFSAGDVRRHIPFTSSLLPWRDALFKIGTKTMFIMENNFRTPADFSAMLKKV